MILLILPVLLLLPGNTVFAESIGSSLNVGILSTKTINIRPFEPLERDIISIYNEVYESLIIIDDNYTPQGYLAESWEESSNGKVWTFTLRPDIRFSDGTPVTAYDVAASAAFILDKAADENITDHGFYSNLAYFVKSVSAKDERTVVVKTKRPYYGLLYEMTFPIVPSSQVSSDNPIGSGPYVIADFQPGKTLSLIANENWWKGKPEIRDIMVSLYETPNQVIEAYEYGHDDTIFTRSTAGAQYKTGAKTISMSYRTGQLECLFMNNSASELTLNARRAIRYVIDRQKIINSIYSGLAVQTNTPFYPGTWLYNDSLDPIFSQNIDEAKRLLAEDGWEDYDENHILDRLDSEGKQQNLHLRFYVYEEPDNDVRLETANMIADQLAQVGIECKVEAMTMANMKEKLRAGSFDLALVAFSMDVCPDPGFLLMRGNTGNYNRYKSSRMTELCEQYRSQTNQEAFRQKAMEIQSLFAEDCPFLCLYYRTGSVISRYLYTTRRDIREYELLRGIESYNATP